ncbi:MAG: STAS domain-containing protein [Candidatus Eutrophobiaceae bacterium]
MDIQISNTDDIIVLKISGEVDLAVAPKVRNTLLKNIKEGGTLLLDLSAIDYIDSSGIACMVEGMQESNKKNAAFALISISDTVLSVLKLARLHEVFKIHDSVETYKAAHL